MLTKDFFNAWKETRSITFQIADTMKNDAHFDIEFKPHPEMNDFGATSSHLVGVVYNHFVNYMKRNVAVPNYVKNQEKGYEYFKKGLEETNKLVLDLMNELTMDDLQKEAYFWEPTKTSYSIGWCIFNLIAHERWTQAQLKMYLKIMGCDTSKIGH